MVWPQTTKIQAGAVGHGQVRPGKSRAAKPPGARHADGRPLTQTEIEELHFRLPPFKTAADMIESDAEEPPQVIQGLLHRGHVCILAAVAKGFKTWAMTDLAVSVNAGKEWLGFPTTKGRVLVVDFELEEWGLRRRLDSVWSARQDVRTDDGEMIDERTIQPHEADPSDIYYMTLRGYVESLDSVIVELTQRVEKLKPDLVILDPIYRVMGDRKENSAEDVASLLNLIQGFARRVGCAVLFTHHFSKGNKSETAVMDRMSGSGVWSRFADAMIILTEHKDSIAGDLFSVEFIQRHMKRPEDTVVSFRYPLLSVVPKEDGHKPGEHKKMGPELKYADEDILAPLREGSPLRKKDWAAACHASIGISRPTFDRRVEALHVKGTVSQLGDKATDPWAIAP